MSTRITLWHNATFHLYQDGFDNENVYLEVDSPPLTVIVLKIPLADWKEMRNHTLQPEERYLDLSEDDLLAEAEREVDVHRAELETRRSQSGKSVELGRMFGSFVFGSPDSSREEMIQHFIDTYRSQEAATPPGTGAKSQTSKGNE